MARETTMDYDNVNDDIVVSINDDDNNEPVATHSMKKVPDNQIPLPPHQPSQKWPQ